jgi:hypothetical protein
LTLNSKDDLAAVDGLIRERHNRLLNGQKDVWARSGELIMRGGGCCRTHAEEILATETAKLPGYVGCDRYFCGEAFTYRLCTHWDTLAHLKATDVSTAVVSSSQDDASGGACIDGRLTIVRGWPRWHIHLCRAAASAPREEPNSAGGLLLHAEHQRVLPSRQCQGAALRQGRHPHTALHAGKDGLVSSYS